MSKTSWHPGTISVLNKVRAAYYRLDLITIAGKAIFGSVILQSFFDLYKSLVRCKLYNGKVLYKTLMFAVVTTWRQLFQEYVKMKCNFQFQQTRKHLNLDMTTFIQYKIIRENLFLYAEMTISATFVYITHEFNLKTLHLITVYIV